MIKSKTLHLFLIIIFAQLVSCRFINNTKKYTASSERVFDKELEIFPRDYRIFEFNFNNQDPSAFGKEYIKGDLPITPSSITVFNNEIFIVDPFHNNVKKIDIETTELTSSTPVSSRRAWLYDVIAFNNRIYVSSEADTIYVFTTGLTLVNKIFITKGKGYFYDVNGDSLIIGYPAEGHKYFTIDSTNSIIRETEGYRDKSNLVHGKFCARTDGDTVITTYYGKIRLKKRYRFEGINLDYDSYKLVYFNTDTTRLFLNVVSFK